MSSQERIEELEKKFAESPRRFFAPLANEYRKAGNLHRAIELCRAHLEQLPNHMSGQVVLGQALFDGDQRIEAKDAFETALSLDPENLIALRHLGDIARDEGRLSDARERYLHLLDVDPRNHEVTSALREIEDLLHATDVPSKPGSGEPLAGLSVPAAAAIEEPDAYTPQSEAGAHESMSGGDERDVEPDVGSADSKGVSAESQLSEGVQQAPGSTGEEQIAVAAGQAGTPIDQAPQGVEEEGPPEEVQPEAADPDAPFWSSYESIESTVEAGSSVEQTVVDSSWSTITTDDDPQRESISAAAEAKDESAPSGSSATASASNDGAAETAAAGYSAAPDDAEVASMGLEATAFDDGHDQGLEAKGSFAAPEQAFDAQAEVVPESSVSNDESEEVEATTIIRYESSTTSVVWKSPEAPAEVAPDEVQPSGAPDHAAELSVEAEPLETAADEEEQASAAWEEVSVAPAAPSDAVGARALDPLPASEGEETEADAQEQIVESAGSQGGEDDALVWESEWLSREAVAAAASDEVPWPDTDEDASDEEQYDDGERVDYEWSEADDAVATQPVEALAGIDLDALDAGSLENLPSSPLGDSASSIFITETMAQLYEQQGYTEMAAAVYRQLSERNPDDARLRERLDEMEKNAAGQTEPSARRRGRTVSDADSARDFFASLVQVPLRPRLARPYVSGRAEIEGGDGLPGARNMSDLGSPAREANSTLSLESVFRIGGRYGAGMPGSQSFSFDQFFAGGGQAPPTGVSPVPGRRGSRRRGGEDSEEIEQFNSWLEGLKRS